LKEVSKVYADGAFGSSKIWKTLGRRDGIHLQTGGLRILHGRNHENITEETIAKTYIHNIHKPANKERRKTEKETNCQERNELAHKAKIFEG